MSLISKCIGRTHDGAGVYEVGDDPPRFVCGWTTGHVLRMGAEATFDTQEAAELAWEIAPQPMKLTSTFHTDSADALRFGMQAVWKGVYTL